MKAYITSSILLQVFLLCFFNTVSGENVVTRSEITEVKVFTSGATIIRNAKTSVEAGQSIIKFENLSPAIDPSSIIVSATGDFTILSVTHQMDYLGPDRKTPEMLKLEDSLLLLNRRRDGILNNISVLQEEQNLLLANKSIGGANTGVKLEDLKNIAQYFRDRLLEIKNSILDYTFKEKKLKAEIDKLNNQLSLLNNKRNEPYSTILVSVNSPLRTAANFTISYYTGNVSWQPAYDIRVKDVGSPVELVYKAMVTQNTGEDWNSIRMKISTGNPSLGAAAPVLYPWYLNFVQYLVAPSAVSPGQTRIKREDGNVTTMEDYKAANQMSSLVTANQNTLNTDYEITIPYSVPSDNLGYAVQIREYMLPASYSFFAIPKIESSAFLVAKVSGWEALDLQPGNSNIYFENAFIGASVFDPATSNDTLQISLGRDKRIIVKREKLKDVSGNQLIGQQRKRNFIYETTIKNNRKEPINLVIKEQYPVSGDKDIEVEINEVSGGEINSEKGEITWSLNIAPAQQVKKTLGFTVKFPKDKPVSGL